MTFYEKIVNNYAAAYLFMSNQLRNRSWQKCRMIREVEYFLLYLKLLKDLSSDFEILQRKNY